MWEWCDFTLRILEVKKKTLLAYDTFVKYKLIGSDVRHHVWCVCRVFRCTLVYSFHRFYSFSYWRFPFHTFRMIFEFYWFLFFLLLFCVHHWYICWCDCYCCLCDCCCCNFTITLHSCIQFPIQKKNQNFAELNPFSLNFFISTLLVFFFTLLRSLLCHFLSFFLCLYCYFKF